MKKRRRYMFSLAQGIYDTFRKTPPKREATGMGQAYFFGYQNPEKGPISPRCGLQGSQARAAWAAGVDNARDDLADKPATPPESKP